MNPTVSTLLIAYALLLAPPLPALAVETATGEPQQAPPAADTSKTAQPVTSAKTEPAPAIPYDQLPLAQLMPKASGGDLAAQFELAMRHSAGRGLPKSGEQALRWLRRAAGAGHAEAALALALKLYLGEDGPTDHGEALVWAQALAAKGDVPAQIMLGNMFANGEGGPRDLVQAYMWYAIAAAGDNPEASEEQRQRLAAAAELRDKTGTLLTPAQEVQAQKLASDWWLSKYGPKPSKARKPAAGKKPATSSTPAKKQGKQV